MNLQEVKITIIISNYNYAHYLPRAIQSAISLIPETEIIVVDDNSSDHSIELLNELKLKYKNLFFYRNTINKGPAYCRNYGMEKATGNYIIFLDADDYFCQNALKTASEFILENNFPKLIITNHNNIFVKDNNSEEYKTKRILNNILYSKNLNPKKLLINYLFTKKLSITAGSIIFHKSIFENIQFCKNLRQNEDLPVFAYAVCNYMPAYLNLDLVNITKHQHSLRNQHHLLSEQKNVHVLADEIFKADNIPSDLQYLKKYFVSQRYLSLFRSYYLAKQYTLAIENYNKAIKNNILCLLKPKYLRKYFKTLVLRFIRGNT